MDIPQLGYLGSAIVGLVSGMGFGYGLAKSRCFEPNALQGQMLMKNQLMMKLFMGCGVASITVVNIYKLFNPGVEMFHEPLYPLADLIGGACLGFGIAVSGGCPGTSPTAAGVGLIKGALGTAVGSFLGVFLWAWTPPGYYSWLFTEGATRDTLDVTLGVSFPVASAGVACFMIAFTKFLDYVYPPNTELNIKGRNVYLGWNPLKLRMNQQAWHPFFGGILLGAQVGLGLWFMKTAMGSSSGFFAIPGFLMRYLSPAVQSFLDPNLKFAKYYGDDPRWIGMGIYQSLLLGGIIVGAKLSTWQDGSSNVSLVRDYYVTDSKHSDYLKCDDSKLTLPVFANALIGATVFAYGTRLVNGCTSGHGVSGMGMLSPASMLYVVGCFGMGISASYIMYFSRRLSTTLVNIPPAPKKQN